MKWDGQQFTQSHPHPPPVIPVEFTIMHEAHKSFGRKWRGTRKGAFSTHTIEALCDTGCQTSIAGEEFLKHIDCPYEYLVPTNHKIMGITDTSLGIIGAVMLRINYKKQTTRQMVYISSKVDGLFLSEEALKDLTLIDKTFQRSVTESKAAACSGIDDDGDDDDNCNCPRRSKPPDLPSSLPMPAIPENVNRLRKWLVDAFSSSAFNTCHHQPLQTMTGEPMDIHIDDGCPAVAVHSPIPVPHHWKYKVKADIDRDVKLGIIEPVPQGTATTWCSRMVVAPKKDGAPRRTIDLQQLNKVSSRETHHTPSPFNLVSTIPTGTLKTVLDAWNGYHSLLIGDDSKHATTFITEWGRYRYCRAPMGFLASGDAYTRRFDDITDGFERLKRCVDDSILWDNGIESAFWHTFHYLKLCSENGIVFNEPKFKFAQKEVEFAGFEITEDGYRPPQRIRDAIRNFPRPKALLI